MYVKCTWPSACIGLARTVYIRCIYDIFGREITKYTVIYGVHTQFWPTLCIYNVYLAGVGVQCTWPAAHTHTHTCFVFIVPFCTYDSKCIVSKYKCKLCIKSTYGF